jgi:hypothetical protein
MLAPAEATGNVEVAWFYGLCFRSVVKHSDRVAIVINSFGGDGDVECTNPDIDFESYEPGDYKYEMKAGSRDVVQLCYEDGSSEGYVKKAKLRRPSEEEADAPWVVAWLESRASQEAGLADLLKALCHAAVVVALHGILVFIVVMICYPATNPCWMINTGSGSGCRVALDGMFSESDGSASGSA